MENIGKKYAINLESIEKARNRIEGKIHTTPILECQSMNNRILNKHNLFFKCENFQKIGAFKIRGATNAIQKLMEKQESIPGVITHSSGNHAQAIALASKEAGIKATIVMPENAPMVKQLAVKGYGGNIVLCEPTNAIRQNTVNQIIEKEHYYMIHPSNDPDVMSGQGTIGLEILDQMKKMNKSIDIIVVPIGGGGLSSGLLIAIKSINPSIRIIGIEPEKACDAYHSYQTGQLQGHQTPPETIADGLRTTLDNNNFPIIKDLIDDIILVSDEEIIQAMKFIWQRMKLVVEPSGAVATAGVFSSKFSKYENYSNVVIILSGGNVDLDNLPWIK